jgi:hypothetical protein
LEDDAARSVNVEHFRDGQPGPGEQPRHVKVGVDFRVERLGVDCGDGRRVLPRDAEIFASRGVGRERDDAGRIAAGAREVLR